NDWDVGRRWISLESPASLIAVQAPHHPVEDDGVKAAVSGARERGLARFHQLDVEVWIEAQRQLQNRADILFVVGAKQSHEPRRAERGRRSGQVRLPSGSCRLPDTRDEPRAARRCFLRRTPTTGGNAPWIAGLPRTRKLPRR